jgi:UDP-N-acetyl-D-mannosaminuronic acid transferase (WecB/TagA/CpsF family)
MPTEQILGIKFFNGEVDQAIDQMCERGGFLVAPSGTCFVRLQRDEAYRAAVSNADLALPDSGAMVLLWKVLTGHSVNRISGWRYMHALSQRMFREKISNVLWILPHERAGESTARWLTENNFSFSRDDFYVAPMYGSSVEDVRLAGLVENRKPGHVIVGIGSGPQEKLGYYLRQNLSYRPAIHCIGAALGFLIGEQVRIPAWADRLYLGWLLRLLDQPRVFGPRALSALRLPFLIARYRENLPPMHG